MTPLASTCRFALALLATLALVAAVPAADAPAPLRARQMIERQQWKRARTLLEAELRAHPGDPALLSAMAEVRAAYGNLPEAEKLARQAVAGAPNDAETHETLARVLGEEAQKAGMLKAMKFAGQFRKEAEAAIAIDPRRPKTLLMLMQFHLQAPGIAGGDKQKARGYAEAIARIDPAKGELAMAEYLGEMKDSTAVEGCFRRAVAKDPANADAHLALAGWLAAPHRKRWDEAAEQAKAAIAADPDRAAGYTTLAFLDARLAQWSELDALFHEADDRIPENRGPWYQAGRALLIDGRELPRAEGCFRHYLGQEPPPNSPSLAHAHWRLGLVLEKQGRKPEAIAELETALKLKPDLEEAKKDLKRLKK